MATRTRDFRWQETSLGPVEVWPEVLVSTVNTLLGTRTPMLLFWGEDLIQFYNDAYSSSLGSDKHPKALGQAGKECWPEVWPVIGPQIDSVLQHGIATWHEGQLVPIFREGVLTDVYWTYSYSPVRKLDGTIRGVLVTCSETTGRVNAEKRSSQLLADLRISEERLRLALSTASGVGTWDWDVVHNRVFADAGFSRMYGVDPVRGAEGAPLEEFLHNIHPEDRARVEEEFDRAMKSGKDFNSEYRLMQADGSIRWVLAKGRCTYAEDGTPVRFPGITLDTTEQKQAAATSMENARQLALAMDGAGLAAWFFDPVRGIVGGDEKIKHLFGLTVQEGPAEIWLAAVHPDDRERVGAEFAASIQGRPYNTEYRVRREDGTVRWVSAKGQLVVTNSSSRMVGICEDFTERKQVEQQLRATAARLGLAQESGKMASWQWDPCHRKLHLG